MCLLCICVFNLYLFLTPNRHIRARYGAAAIEGSPSSTQASVQLMEKLSPLGFIPDALPAYSTATATKPFTIPPSNLTHTHGNPIASEEPTLDVDILGGVGQGNGNWYVQRVGWALSVFSEIASWRVVPGVLSVSYAVAEPACYRPDNCTAYPGGEYMAAANEEFMKVGVLLCVMVNIVAFMSG